jgi:hypothetical protein
MSPVTDLAVATRDRPEADKLSPGNYGFPVKKLIANRLADERAIAIR